MRDLTKQRRPPGRLLPGERKALITGDSSGIRLSPVVPGVVDTHYFDRRKAPYQRGSPRPIAAQVVAAAIADAAGQRRDTVIVPEWPGWPARLKGAFLPPPPSTAG